MLKKSFFLVAVLCLASQAAKSQDTKYAIEAIAVGGKEQVQQVLETQLTLPKSLLSSHFEVDLMAYFQLDSAGNAKNIKIEGGANNLLRKEIIRVMGLINFNRTQNIYKDPYFLNFKLSANKYANYFKQNYKLNLKTSMPADSSNIIYTKADKAPEYFKNGEAGLEEFILTHMEYPKIAIERSIEGTVVIEFVVETNGYITGITVKRGIGGGCTEEALKVIMPTRWQPASLNNKLVRYRTSYPITFNLRNISKDNTGTSQMTGQ